MARAIASERLRGEGAFEGANASERVTAQEILHGEHGVLCGEIPASHARRTISLRWLRELRVRSVLMARKRARTVSVVPVVLLVMVPRHRMMLLHVRNVGPFGLLLRDHAVELGVQGL